MEIEEYHQTYKVEETFWWHKGLRRVVLTLVDPYLRGEHPLRILDAGCGTGAFLSLLSRRGWIVGMDFSPTVLELARRRGPRDLVGGSVLSLPFEPDTPVYTADDDIIKATLGLRNDGLYMGIMEGYSIPVYLPPRHMLTKHLAILANSTVAELARQLGDQPGR